MMTRALFPTLRAVALVAVFAGAHSLAVGGPSGGDRRAGASFTLLTTAAPPKSTSTGNSNGVGVGPSKPVVSNPYNVPLLQNAGSLRSTR